MRVMYKRYEWEDGEPKPDYLTRILESTLEASSSRGAVENAEEIAKNASEALAKLITLLTEKGLISPQEALRVAGCDGTVTVIGEES